VKKLLIALLLSLTGLSSNAQTLKAGDTIPDLTIIEWLDNPHYEREISFDKPMIIDFWFTTCGPCIYTMPKINNLSELYGKSIDFLTISFEERQTLQNYLAERKLLAHVGSDTAKVLIDHFGITSYPRSFVINSNKEIVWYGHPTNLSSEIIDRVLPNAYKQNIQPEIEGVKLSSYEYEGEKVHPIDIKVNKYMGQASGASTGPGEITTANYSVPKILEIGMNISQSKIITGDTLKYDVYFAPEKVKFKNLEEEFTKSFLHEMNYTAEKRRTLVQGYRLSLDSMELFASNAIDNDREYKGKGSTTMRDGTWKATGYEIPDLVRGLENHLGIIIASEIDLNGYFYFEMPISSLEAARETLKEKYGLLLEPAEIEAEIVVVESQGN
jgi:thiol-disulfide isomerase/thioredoxin